MRTVIFGLILFPVVSSEFLAYKGDSLIIKRYERLGADVVLHCHTPLPVIEWWHNGSIIHTGEKELSLRNVRKHHAGTYYCQNPENKEVQSVIELHLGAPPERLDVQCWASGYPERINCTWDLHPDTDLHTTFITTYRLGLMGPEPPSQCVQPDHHNPKSCLITDFKMFEERPYLVNVTAITPLGSLTKLHHFFVESIIRPDPPVNVSLSPVPGDCKKLLLQWSPPPSWPYVDYFPLSYIIRYKRTGAKSCKMVGPYETTSFLFTGLRFGSTVHVQVAVRDFTGSGNYSDWSAVAVGQPWRKC